MAKKKKAKRAKKAKKTTRASKKEVLIVASKMKNYIRSKGFMCSSQAIQAASDCVYSCLDRAMERADANRRSTVKIQDL